MSKKQVMPWESFRWEDNGIRYIHERMQTSVCKGVQTEFKGRKGLPWRIWEGVTAFVCRPVEKAGTSLVTFVVTDSMSDP